VKCERQFGFETFQISVPSLPPSVVINDPKNLEYVFKNEGIFTKGDFFKRRSWDLFGMFLLTLHLFSLLSQSTQETGLLMQTVTFGKYNGKLV
jgi:hypothetical protein